MSKRFFILEKGLIVYTILFILQLLKRLQFGDEQLWRMQ
ncbi:protein of unknown function [Latilactobacillus sakei]|nr:protein of unknown function [Latilactobacillus sakei]